MLVVEFSVILWCASGQQGGRKDVEGELMYLYPLVWFSPLKQLEMKVNISLIDVIFFFF